MPATVKSESPRTHHGESSFVSLLSGWAQQGVQSFFATQRILLDLAMRQNASLMHSLRQQLSDPQHSPTALLGEVTAEGMSNFIEGQRVLLELGQKQNEILMTGVKERVGEWPPAQAVADLLQRSVETFIHMQQEFHDYLTKPFSVEELVARVEAILRRSGKSTESQLLVCRDLILDDEAHQVSRGERLSSSP